jgi:amino-acid N-acetyltransferase
MFIAFLASPPYDGKLRRMHFPRSHSSRRDPGMNEPNLKPLPIDSTPLPAPSPATADDVSALFNLIDVTSRTTTVLPRTRDNICDRLRDFLVVRRDGRILACGALNVCTPGLAEIKSLVVAPELRSQGIGGKLVLALVEEGRRLGIRRLFALTDNPPFFERLGFSRVDKATLPHKVWNECIRCPKFLNCQEEAVEILLNVEPARPDL